MARTPRNLLLPEGLAALPVAATQELAPTARVVDGGFRGLAGSAVLTVLQFVAKSVRLLFNGVEAVMVLTFENSEIASLV